MTNIQFSKKNKSHLRHARTQSNQVGYEDDNMSNFSNSLKNISQ